MTTVPDGLCRIDRRSASVLCAVSADGRLIGIVTYGITYERFNAEPMGRFAGFTRISSFVKWIDAQIKRELDAELQADVGNEEN